MFNPTFWAVTQPLDQNNPIAGFVLNLPSAGLYLTQYFLDREKWKYCDAFNTGLNNGIQVRLGKPVWKLFLNLGVVEKHTAALRVKF